MQKALFSIAMALLLGAPARAAIYPAPYNPGSFDSPGTGLVNADGFTDNESVTGLRSSLQSLILTFTFSDSSGLDINSSGSSAMTGVLTLYGASSVAGSSALNDITGTYSGGNWVYTADLSANFSGLNPNNTWGLALGFPSGNSQENTLVSWDLNITAVPEPITYALPLFGLIFLGGTVGRFYLRRRRQA